MTVTTAPPRRPASTPRQTTHRTTGQPGVRFRTARAAALMLALATGTAVGPAAAADPPASGGAAREVPAVVVAPVVSQAVEREGRFVGTVKAIQSVDLKPQVSGYLQQVAFEQGGPITAGQLLYQIEPAPFEAALASARGQVAAAAASLDAAKAKLVDAQADFDRQSVLIKKGDTSQTMFDQSRATRDEAAAAVEQAKAGQQQAAASQQTAEINLGYTRISSPIAGRIGATRVTAGNLVGPDSGTLATVVQIDPIRVVFSIPSATFVRVRQDQTAAGDTGDPALTTDVLLPTGDTYAHPGTIAFADNQVDATTGTVAIYADFPNPDGLLLPGQYVTTRVHQAQAARLPMVPAAALLRTRDGDQVYVVGDDHRVEVRTVKTGPQVGTDLAITSGLTEGELVIVSGLQKVKPGMVVRPVRAADAATSSEAGASGTAPKPAAQPTGDAQ